MKKLLSVLLASATAVTACAGLAACEEADSHELVIWCPSAAQAVYTQLGEEFVSTYKDGAYKDYTVKCIAHEEGNAETDLGVDLSQGADVYFTEGGQIERLISKGYIQPLSGEYASYATAVKAESNEKALPTATKGDTVYAFPATADNTWFFWYDSTFFDDEDLESFDTIFNKAKEANKNIAFAYDNGWYNSAWFMTAGCTMDYVDDNGTKKYKIDVNSDKGLAAAESLLYYVSRETGMTANGEEPVIIGCDNSTIPNGAKAGTLVAGFQGSWISEDLKGTNIVPAAKAPKIKIGGEEKEMINFFTFKYCGVNPARKNVDVAMELAAFLTSEHGQAARFEATGSVPANKAAAASDEVAASPIAAAIADRANNAYIQNSQTADFWTALETFGKNMRLEEGATTNDTLAEAVRLLQVGILGDETQA